jgi:TonB family protein
MNPSINNDRLAALLALAILTPTSGICDDEDEVQIRHLSDSSTDRTPAITAFPKYPSIARRDRIEGEAVVCFMVDVDGSIRRPSIRSSTHKIFEKPAMDAIRRSTFEPLARGESLSTSRTCRTYRFRLESVTASNDPDS